MTKVRCEERDSLGFIHFYFICLALIVFLLLRGVFSDVVCRFLIAMPLCSMGSKVCRLAVSPVPGL